MAGRFAIAAGVGGGVGSALEDIGDIDLFSGELHRREHFGEKISRSANKRFALLVLIGARGFPDEHQASFRIADPKNDLGAGFGEVRTDLAGESLRAEKGEAFRFGSGGGRGWSGHGTRFGLGGGSDLSLDPGDSKGGGARQATNEAGG